MARLPRLYAPQVPQLAQVRFSVPLSGPGAGSDILDLLAQWLAQDARLHRVAVHAWAISFDQLLILATPGGPAGLSSMLQSLGRRLAARLRIGQVFAGRYRSTLAEPGRWVVPAMLWLEGLPQRLALVGDAEHWRWSSAAQHMGGESAAGFVADHADYWALGNTPFDRQARYRARLQEGLGRTDTQRIERALRGQWALGEPAFLAALDSVASRRVAVAPRGRPRKQPAGTETVRNEP